MLLKIKVVMGIHDYTNIRIMAIALAILIHKAMVVIVMSKVIRTVFMIRVIMATELFWLLKLMC